MGENKKSLIDFDAMHSVQLEILREFDRVCRKNNIRYFLIFGTLIGAVRDHAIIPWDDDIDVVVPRMDYERLLQLDQSEWKTPFFFQTAENSPDYCKCYAKLRNSDTTLIERTERHKNINHGISIDIYSMINLADDMRKRKIQLIYSAIYMLLTENHPAQNHGRFFKFASAVVIKITPTIIKERLKKACEKKMLAYLNIKTRDSFILAGFNGLKIPIRNKYFKRTAYGKLGDYEFPIPSGYHEYLTITYGDYMKRPEKKEQDMKVEGFIKVDVNRPYTYYKNKLYFVKE